MIFCSIERYFYRLSNISLIWLEDHAPQTLFKIKYVIHQPYSLLYSSLVLSLF